MNKHKFVGLHSFVRFAIPLYERDVFYHAVHVVWCEYKSARALGIPMPVVFLYMTDEVQSETGLECDLI